MYKLLPHHEESIHLTDMPKVITYKDEEEIMGLFELFFELEEKVNKELENARNNKEIGSSLEAEVHIKLEEKYQIVKEKLGPYLHQLFIVSKVVYDDKADGIQVIKSNGHKCARCWNYVDTLEDDICPRCHSIINKPMN